MNLFKNVDESWIPLLHSLAYKEPLVNFLNNLSQISYQPELEKIFKVFEMPVKDVKVVILGCDPYPRPGDAIGYSYGISENSEMPRVLRNIHMEIICAFSDDNGLLDDNTSNCILDSKKWQTLEHWKEQGIFLLNTALTVETGNAGSHLKYWREFTEAVVSYLSYENPSIWLLWGTMAEMYKGFIKNPIYIKGYDMETIEEIPIDPKLNYVGVGRHPFMAIEGDFSNNAFYKTNKILTKRSLKKINW